MQGKRRHAACIRNLGNAGGMCKTAGKLPLIVIPPVESSPA